MYKELFDFAVLDYILAYSLQLFTLDIGEGRHYFAAFGNFFGDSRSICLVGSQFENLSVFNFFSFYTHNL